MPLKISLIGPDYSGKKKISEFLQDKYKLHVIDIEGIIKKALDYVKPEEVENEEVDKNKKKGRAKGK